MDMSCHSFIRLARLAASMMKKGGTMFAMTYHGASSSGLKDFDRLLAEAAERAPLGELVDIMDVGFACAYLATPYGRRIADGTIYVDGGANIRA